MTVRSPNSQEEKLKLKAAALLEADRVRLLMDQPFVGAILIRQNLIPVVDSRCQTAATDGQNIFVHPEFYLAMPPGERRFLLAHEVWHTVMPHFLRRKDRDKELFNVAADMEVNFLLAQERFRVPESALMPLPEWRGLNAEEIYEKLLKDQPEESVTIDVHLEPGDGTDGSAGTETADEVEADIVFDPDFIVDFGDHPEELAREKAIEAATAYERKRGELPGNIARIVDRFRKGKLPWKELLAQFVTSCFGGERRWLPPNRRYISSGLYLQSRRDSRFKAVLAVDTSGSTAKDLPRFAGELTGLLNSFGDYELKVICCDSRIQSVEDFSPMHPFNGGSVKFTGGGGTSFKPVFDFLKKEKEPPTLLIYLTDGDGDVPDKPDYPVMWVITPDGRNRIPWGYEVQMD
jgi:predicted metal-dependent peptidase